MIFLHNDNKNFDLICRYVACSKEESHGCPVKGKLVRVKFGENGEIIAGDLVLTSNVKVHEDEIDEKEMEDLQFKQYLWQQCLSTYWETPWQIYSRAILNPQ